MVEMVGFTGWLTKSWELGSTRQLDLCLEPRTDTSKPSIWKPFLTSWTPMRLLGEITLNEGENVWQKPGEQVHHEGVEKANSNYVWEEERMKTQSQEGLLVDQEKPKEDRRASERRVWSQGPMSWGNEALGQVDGNGVAEQLLWGAGLWDGEQGRAGGKDRPLGIRGKALSGLRPGERCLLTERMESLGDLALSPVTGGSPGAWEGRGRCGLRPRCCASLPDVPRPQGLLPPRGHPGKVSQGPREICPLQPLLGGWRPHSGPTLESQVYT